MLRCLKYLFLTGLSAVLAIILYLGTTKVNVYGRNGQTYLSFIKRESEITSHVYSQDSTDLYELKDNKTGKEPRRYQGKIVLKAPVSQNKPNNGDPRIFCWIMTHAKNYNARTVYVNNTWARRCTKYVFVVGQTDVKMSVPLVQLNMTEGRNHLTQKTVLAFTHIYTHYLNEADWFLKADDDTYIIMDHLKDFLRDKDPNDAVFFGQTFKSLWKNPHSLSYFSGGAGYVLSREALRRFGEEAPSKSSCPKDGTVEDYDISSCLQKIGVKLGNSSDSLGRNRFNCFSPMYLLYEILPNWYKDIEANGGKSGKAAISGDAISFHYVEGRVMYLLDLLLYHVRSPQNSNVTKKATGT